MHDNYHKELRFISLNKGISNLHILIQDMNYLQQNRYKDQYMMYTHYFQYQSKFNNSNNIKIRNLYLICIPLHKDSHHLIHNTIPDIFQSKWIHKSNIRQNIMYIDFIRNLYILYNQYSIISKLKWCPCWYSHLDILPNNFRLHQGNSSLVYILHNRYLLSQYINCTKNHKQHTPYPIMHTIQNILNTTY